MSVVPRVMLLVFALDFVGHEEKQSAALFEDAQHELERCRRVGEVLERVMAGASSEGIGRRQLQSIDETHSTAFRNRAQTRRDVKPEFVSAAESHKIPGKPDSIFKYRIGLVDAGLKLCGANIGHPFFGFRRKLT